MLQLKEPCQPSRTLPVTHLYLSRGGLVTGTSWEERTPRPNLMGIQYTVYPSSLVPTYSGLLHTITPEKSHGICCLKTKLCMKTPIVKNEISS